MWVRLMDASRTAVEDPTIDRDKPSLRGPAEMTVRPTEEIGRPRPSFISLMKPVWFSTNLVLVALAGLIGALGYSSIYRTYHPEKVVDTTTILAEQQNDRAGRARVETEEFPEGIERLADDLDHKTEVAETKVEIDGARLYDCDSRNPGPPSSHVWLRSNSPAYPPLVSVPIASPQIDQRFRCFDRYWRVVTVSRRTVIAVPDMGPSGTNEATSNRKR